MFLSAGRQIMPMNVCTGPIVAERLAWRMSWRREKIRNGESGSQGNARPWGTALCGAEEP